MGSPISKETFLQRARARFAEHYDYDQIVYKSYKSPILIRCRLHPVKLISITPEKHLQTSGGCKFCLRQSRIRMLERELQRAPAVREVSLAPERTLPQERLSPSERPEPQERPALSERPLSQGRPEPREWQPALEPLIAPDGRVP
jgi:hypothetical protein